MRNKDIHNQDKMVSQLIFKNAKKEEINMLLYRKKWEAAYYYQNTKRRRSGKRKMACYSKATMATKQLWIQVQITGNNDGTTTI